MNLHSSNRTCKRSSLAQSIQQFLLVNHLRSSSYPLRTGWVICSTSFGLMRRTRMDLEANTFLLKSIGGMFQDATKLGRNKQLQTRPNVSSRPNSNVSS